MTIGAIATKDSIVGGQRTTDGLWKHYSAFDVGSLRVTSRAGHPALTGAGVETIYLGSTSGGQIQCFNRDTQLFEPLSLSGSSIYLNILPGGSLYLPPSCISSSQIIDGAIQTADIAANATQQQIGLYQSGNGWQTSGTNVWLETTIQISGAFSGANVVRIEYALSFYNNTAGAANQIALGLDGSMSWPVVNTHQTSANYVNSVGGTFYTGGLSGTHRISIFANTNVGVLTFLGSFYQCLAVTEQKR